MKKIEVLEWGVKHIASNHSVSRKVVCNTDYEECQSMSITDTEVPTVHDARMLCEDLGMERDRCYADNSWGVTVIDVEGWADTIGQQEYTPTGMEMWKRYGVEIGSLMESPSMERREPGTASTTAHDVNAGDMYDDLPF